MDHLHIKGWKSIHYENRTSRVWKKDSSLCRSPAPGSSDAKDALSNAAQIEVMPMIPADAAEPAP